MTEPTVENLVRAAIAGHEDPQVIERATRLAAGARRLASRRRTARLMSAAGATVAVISAGAMLAVALRPEDQAPGSSHPTTTTASTPPDPAQQAVATRLDQAFRAVWTPPDGNKLILVSPGSTRPGTWTGSYRYPATDHPAEPGFTVARPGRPPTPAELNPCARPDGPITSKLCQLTTRPDGSRLLSYERSGMDGRHWNFANLATHFRTTGEVVTVQIGISSDDGTAIMPDWAFGPTDLPRMATDPRLTLR